MLITITEALAELKTIDKRIAKKQEFVFSYLYRQEALKDPLVGGSAEEIRRERQAITDLQTRKVDIRRAIQDVNARSEITVEGETRSVADWLVWRREVAPQEQSFLNQINARIQAVRQDAQRKGAQVVSEGKAERASDVIVNLSEVELAHQIEHLENVLGILDGQLSLKNATLVIDI